METQAQKFYKKISKSIYITCIWTTGIMTRGIEIEGG